VHEWYLHRITFEPQVALFLNLPFHMNIILAKGRVAEKKARRYLNLLDSCLLLKLIGPMAVNFAYTMQACCITSLSRFKEWAQYFVAALTFDLQIREKEEDMKILEYIRAKDAREQEIAFEKERIRHEKEMETVRLRTMQERAADKQAELDELRARRYQETKEREWRAKEKAAAERHATMQRELEDAREAQKAAKMLQRAEMAKVEHDEFMRVLAVNHARELEDLQMQAAALTINDKYKEELQAQIASNEELKKKERQMYLEEGRRIREAAEMEKARLAAIKARKLKDLEDAGVPAKYRAELEKYKLQIR